MKINAERQIYLPAVPLETTKENIMDVFDKFGKIETIWFETDAGAKQKRAYVAFSTFASVIASVNANAHDILGLSVHAQKVNNTLETCINGQSANGSNIMPSSKEDINTDSNAYRFEFTKDDKQPLKPLGSFVSQHKEESDVQKPLQKREQTTQKIAEKISILQDPEINNVQKVSRDIVINTQEIEEFSRELRKHGLSSDDGDKINDLSKDHNPPTVPVNVDVIRNLRNENNECIAKLIHALKMALDFRTELDNLAFG
ncbi:hypothetical protein ACOME3_001791 [Neoechinorhynchus agilis]